MKTITKTNRTQTKTTSKIIDELIPLDFITYGVASNKLGMTKHHLKLNIAKYNTETSRNRDGHTTVNIVELEKALTKDDEVEEVDEVNLTTKASDFIQNPMNYEGGKGKLLNKIISMFPSKINRFIEPFGGALTVGTNVVANKTYSSESIEILKKKTFITQGSMIDDNIWNSIVNNYNDAEKLDIEAADLLIQSEGKKFKGIQKRVDIGRDLNIFKVENKSIVGALGKFKESLPWCDKTSENYMKIAKDEDVINFVNRETNINTSLTYAQVLKNCKVKGVEFMAALNGDDEAFQKIRKKKKKNITDEAEKIIDKHKDNEIDKFKGRLPDDRLKEILAYSKSYFVKQYIDNEVKLLNETANNTTFKNNLEQVA